MDPTKRRFLGIVVGLITGFTGKAVGHPYIGVVIGVVGTLLVFEFLERRTHKLPQ